MPIRLGSVSIRSRSDVDPHTDPCRRDFEPTAVRRRVDIDPRRSDADPISTHTDPTSIRHRACIDPMATRVCSMSIRYGTLPTRLRPIRIRDRPMPTHADPTSNQHRPDIGPCRPAINAISIRRRSVVGLATISADATSTRYRPDTCSVSIHACPTPIRHRPMSVRHRSYIDPVPIRYGPNVTQRGVDAASRRCHLGEQFRGCIRFPRRGIRSHRVIPQMTYNWGPALFKV